MTEQLADPGGIQVELTGVGSIHLTDLVLDFSGTLAADGLVLPGVSSALARLASRLRITVASADTFGSAVEELEGMPVTVRLVETGEQKALIARELNPEHLVAIGNGRNDIPMCQTAALSIAVLGPEGAAAGLLGVVDLVAADIGSALELLLNPARLRATLRP